MSQSEKNSTNDTNTTTHNIQQDVINTDVANTQTTEQVDAPSASINDMHTNYRDNESDNENSSYSNDEDDDDNDESYDIVPPLLTKTEIPIENLIDPMLDFINNEL